MRWNQYMRGRWTTTNLLTIYHTGSASNRPKISTEATSSISPRKSSRNYTTKSPKTYHNKTTTPIQPAWSTTSPPSNLSIPTHSQNTNPSTPRSWAAGRYTLCIRISSTTTSRSKQRKAGRVVTAGSWTSSCRASSASSTPRSNPSPRRYRNYSTTLSPIWPTPTKYTSRRGSRCLCPRATSSDSRMIGRIRAGESIRPVHRWMRIQIRRRSWRKSNKIRKRSMLVFFRTRRNSLILIQPSRMDWKSRRNINSIKILPMLWYP